MTLDDLELLHVRIFKKFRLILQIGGQQWQYKPILSATELRPTKYTFQPCITLILPGVPPLRSTLQSE